MFNSNQQFVSPKDIPLWVRFPTRKIAKIKWVSGVFFMQNQSLKWIQIIVVFYIYHAPYTCIMVFDISVMYPQGFRRVKYVI